jgi:aryl-alcohol dehydrogenase-like predicted oxidoreductase
MEYRTLGRTDGAGESEEIFAKALRGRRDDVMLARRATSR